MSVCVCVCHIQTRQHQMCWARACARAHVCVCVCVSLHPPMDTSTTSASSFSCAPPLLGSTVRIALSPSTSPFITCVTHTHTCTHSHKDSLVITLHDLNGYVYTCIHSIRATKGAYILVMAGRAHTDMHSDTARVKSSGDRLLHAHTRKYQGRHAAYTPATPLSAPLPSVKRSMSKPRCTLQLHALGCTRTFRLRASRSTCARVCE